MAKQRNQQQPETEKPNMVVDHVLYYTSKTRMDLDADQFVKYPRILEDREPAMRPYGISLKSVEVVGQKLNNPPVVKHELHLKLTIEGIPDKIKSWKTATNSFVNRRTTMTASEALRDYHASKGD